MVEQDIRADIAFIRRAIEDGRSYANARGPDMVVWGIASTIGFLGTYGRVRGWLIFDPNWLWALCIGLPWLYSLRRVVRRLTGGTNQPAANPMVSALRMLWLGCGVALTVLYLAASWTGDIRQGWFAAVGAGMLGVGFFTSAWLSNLTWLRWVGLGWWVGEMGMFALRHRPEGLLLGAALMLLLLAGPGFVLLARGGARPQA
jgi:hypothetical protein